VVVIIVNTVKADLAWHNTHFNEINSGFRRSRSSVGVVIFVTVVVLVVVDIMIILLFVVLNSSSNSS
jgi:hypothetical protein